MSDYSSEFQCDIAIVGAGLVGATLAALLLQQKQNRALTIALIDQRDTPQSPNLGAKPPEFDPRVVALSPHSIKILEEIGTWPQIENQRVCYYPRMVVWNHEGTGKIKFDAQDLNQPHLGAIVENSLLVNAIVTSFRNNEKLTYICHQPIASIETVFVARAKERCQKKRLTLSEGIKIEASLVIAADGAHSTIREKLKMPIRSRSYNHSAIVTTVECEYSHQHTAWQSFLPTGPLAFLPLGEASEKFCSIVWSAETKKAENLMAMEDEKFIQQLAEAFESRLGAIKRVDRRYHFPLVQRHAIDYFIPQVALVGDAAHTIHPLAGQGVNLGFLDAQVLSREIERALQRQLTLADISILRRYQRCRKRHNMEVMLLMETLKKLFGHRQLAARWIRNTGLNLVNGSPSIKQWLAKQAMRL